MDTNDQIKAILNNPYLNAKQASQRINALALKCPKCNHKSAITKRIDKLGFAISYCRYCDYVSDPTQK